MESSFSPFASNQPGYPGHETKHEIPFQTQQLSFGLGPYETPSLSFASPIDPALFSQQTEVVWRSVQPQDIETLGSNDVWRSVNPHATSYDFISSSASTVQDDFGSLPSLDAKPSFSSASPSFASLSIDPKHQVGPFDSAPATKSSLPLQSIHDQATPNPPAPPGGYLEPSYHFLSCTRPLTLLQSVLQFLEEKLVDCIAKYDKYKVSCVAYKEGGRLHFTIRIFSVPQGKLAIEFQRREGCVMHFNELYRSGRETLKSKRLVDVEEQSSPSDTDTSPSFESESSKERIQPLQDPTCEQVRETLRCLLAQATNDTYLDVKIGALSALARLTVTGCDVVQEVLVSDGAVEAFVNDLYSDVEDVHRCAATGLANLAAKKDGVCARIVNAGGVKKLVELARSKVPEVVRECAQALAKIGSQLGARVLDDNFKKALEHCRCSPDPRAREHVAGLMESLKV